MYRDDTCPSCGESLPPDHLYCREHSVDVDDRLHALGTALVEAADQLAEAARLIATIHPDTFDYLAEDEPDDPEWPPRAGLHLAADAEELDVDVDAEPGRVAVRVDTPLAELLAAAAATVGTPDLRRFADACTRAAGTNVTH